ncbi:MAG: twitching motility protein PilT, partial [Lachnospiraceae bacterium]|nr:twitching motility protein PilT [Lachnospiraceae bacterium]
MIQIICGEKGKGKTKILLDHVSKAVKEANGSLVYLDKSNQHMFELSNRVRLINCTEYMISNSSEFVGFISGIISQDHDLETIYLDSFLKVAKTTKDNLE